MLRYPIIASVIGYQKLEVISKSRRQSLNTRQGRWMVIILGVDWAGRGGRRVPVDKPQPSGGVERQGLGR